MMIVCNLATAAWFLGAWPSQAIVHRIPESRLAGYTEKELSRAASCAAKLKLRYRIVKG